MTYCHDCARLRLLIKLKRGEMLHTLCMDVQRLKWLADDIDLLEQELAEHMLTHSLLYPWPVEIQPCLN